MLEHIPGLPDLILFLMNDVSVIRVFRCGITRGTLSGKHVLTLIWMIMIGGSFKTVSNWAVLTNGVCGDWCMTSSLLCQQSLHLPKCIIVIPSPNIRNQCPRLRELAGRPRLLGLLFSTVTSSLCLPLSPSLFGSSPCGTTPLRRLPCPFGGTGFSSTDDLATLLGSPAPLSNLPNQSQHDQSSKCLRQLYVDFHGRKIWLLSVPYPSEEQESKKFTTSFRAWRAIFLICWQHVRLQVSHHIILLHTNTIPQTRSLAIHN